MAENETPKPPSLSDVGTQDSNPEGLPSLQDVQNAMSQSEPETPSEPEPSTPTPTENSQEDPSPIGQLSADELSELREQAEAFQALNEHPEILREAIQKMQAKFGQPPQEDDEPQNGSPQQLPPEVVGRLDRMEQALSMLASRFVNNEFAQREPQWETLKPQVEKLMSEVPGLTIEQAVRFAKAEAGGHQGGQQGAAPTLQTTEAHGAVPRVGETSSEEEFKSAVKKISSLKSTSDAADFAIREAMRLNQKS